MATLALAKLVNRKLLRISGPDCYSYLQGLVCNDVRYLYEPERIPKRKHAISSPNALSTFMLNAQGRAICDMILYRTPSTRNECKFLPPGQASDPDELLIECDSSLASGIANTLYGYRVRRKIYISMEDRLSVWCLFPNHNNHVTELKLTEKPTLVNTNPLQLNEILSDELSVVLDPRIYGMGLRIISRHKEFQEIKRSLQSVINQEIHEVMQRHYSLYRFALGVGEGVQDHPESNCLPLEANADFLGSVSFTKGCYLGQELTARIHHTGVVRKRLMPILLDQEPIHGDQETIPLINGSDILLEGTKKKVGILRQVIKNRGLALLRHDLVSDSQQLIHDGTKITLSAYKPYWWDTQI